MILHDPYAESLRRCLANEITISELSSEICERGAKERKEFLEKLKEKLAEETKENNRKRTLFSVSL